MNKVYECSGCGWTGTKAEHKAMMERPGVIACCPDMKLVEMSNPDLLPCPFCGGTPEVALIMAVCAVAGAAIVAIWLLCCAISGCDGAPEPALAYNIQRGIYGNELCDSDDLWHGFHARQMPGLLTTEETP